MGFSVNVFSENKLDEKEKIITTEQKYVCVFFIVFQGRSDTLLMGTQISTSKCLFGFGEWTNEISILMSKRTTFVVCVLKASFTV